MPSGRNSKHRLQLSAYLGRAGQPPDRTTRPSLRLGLHFWRRLPGARHWRRAGAVICRRGRDEPAFGHDQRARRAWRARGLGARRRWLISTGRQATPAGQHQPAIRISSRTISAIVFSLPTRTLPMPVATPGTTINAVREPSFRHDPAYTVPKLPTLAIAAELRCPPTTYAAGPRSS